MTTPQDVPPEERAKILRAIEKIDERNLVANPGFHSPGAPAEAAALAASGLPGSAVMLWQRWDGFDVAGGESRLLPIGEFGEATERAKADEALASGDLVVGEAGRDLFVLPQDPWAEGADVIRVEEDGTRAPEASSVAHLLLGLMAEASVIYGDDGEFRDELIGEDAELTSAIKRKLLRRRLDHDPDAPRARLELARELRRAGEHRAARRELTAVLKRAPDWCWAHHELAGALADGQDHDGARRSHERAAEHATDAAVQAYFLACAAAECDGESRRSLAARVLKTRPEFAAEQERAAAALLDNEDPEAALLVLRLGLAVAPTSLTLLEMRRRASP